MNSSTNLIQKKPKNKMFLGFFFDGKTILILLIALIILALGISLIVNEMGKNYFAPSFIEEENEIKIQSITRTNVFVQNVGGSPVTITEVYVDGTLVTENVDYTITNGIDIPQGKTETITFIYDLPTPQVTIKVVTSDGISSEYTEIFS